MDNSENFWNLTKTEQNKVKNRNIEKIRENNKSSINKNKKRRITLELLDELKKETDSLIQKKDNIFNLPDSTIFIETYIIELMEFYNVRYVDYKNIEFKNIKDYIPYLRFKKQFKLDIIPFSKNQLVNYINIKNKDLATLIGNTDIADKIVFPLKLSNLNIFENIGYLKEPLLEVLKLEDLHSLLKFSKNLCVIPSELEFSTIFFDRQQAVFKNYFEIVEINPFNNQTVQLIGEDREIYRKSNIMKTEDAMSIDKLAIYHKKTKKRNIDGLVENYQRYYKFLNNSDNYISIRNKLYDYTYANYSQLCIF